MPWKMVIFITIMVRNFILLARRKIYVTPESILNGVQYSATQMMYNATSGHAVIYVGPLRLLEPNTYECPIRTIRTYWAEILIFD